MCIHDVFISERVADKIWDEHGVSADEATELLYGNPMIRRARDGRYMAVGLSPSGYLTVSLPDILGSDPPAGSKIVSIAGSNLLAEARNGPKSLFNLREGERCRVMNLTVIFEYHRGVAEIVTAYPSSDW